MAGHLTLLQTSRHWLCFSSCVCFSWYSWLLPPCKLTATTPHCQPTTLHEFLLFFLLAPNAVLSNLALFNSRTFSWKLVYRQMPIKSTQSQNYPNGAWVTSLDSSAGLLLATNHPPRPWDPSPDSLGFVESPFKTSEIMQPSGRSCHNFRDRYLIFYKQDYQERIFFSHENMSV